MIASQRVRTPRIALACVAAIASSAPVQAQPAEAQPAEAQPAEAQPAHVPPVAGSGVVQATVVSLGTGGALADVRVRATGAGRAVDARTDAAGNCRLVLPAGRYRLSFALPGHVPEEQDAVVAAATTTTLEVALAGAPGQEEVIVVVGSRTPRSSAESTAPVDVVTAEVLRGSGQAETNQAVAAVAPSYNATHQAVSDGSDHIDPASLRGLGPDQVLVLVNGKRRHQSALLHVNPTFGRGTVGTDLNAIPLSAVKRIEVLRDGASAQYGSDAIAGVINVMLKDAADPSEFTLRTGITGSGDGALLQGGVNLGVPLARRGHLQLTAEFLGRQATDRSDPYTGDIFPGVEGEAATVAELARRGRAREDYSIRLGQSEALEGETFFNATFPLGRLELYGFGGYGQRRGSSTGFYRLPREEERIVPDLYPEGFLPRIEPTIIDWSATAGSRLERGPWHLDLSASHGGNRFDYSIANSVNASLGVDSPTRFDAGALQFSQSTGNVDLVRRFELGDARALSLVGGAELRREQYAIEAGQPESYVLGPETTSSGAPKTAGAQVFPGFQPDNEVDAARTSIGAYAGVESELGDALDLDAAGRYEAYSDFGQTATGKVAARYELADGVALRATVSTGFRAPSLHQVWFSSISTQTVENPETGALEPRQVLTSNNASDVAGAFGMPPLAEERSRSLSVGGSARLADRLTMTVDAYSTSIADRIVLTSRFTSQTPMVSEILSPFPGVSQAQFFANAVDTRTRGVDVVVDYRTGLGAGVLDLIGSANFNRTEVMAIHVPQSVADRFAGGDLGAVREVFLSREERGRLEEALPGRRATLHAKYSLDRLAIVSRARYFGPVRYRAADPDKDEFFGDKVIFDLDLGYALSPGWRLSLGGTNILNTFPDRQRDPENISFGRFPYSRRVSQFGLDGAFYYLRAQWLL